MGKTSAGGKVKEKEAGMWLDKKTVSSSLQKLDNGHSEISCYVRVTLIVDINIK